jgi:hypothetical protein
MEVSGELYAPAALPPWKEPAVPIAKEVGWVPEPVWTTWRSENPSPRQDSNSDSLVVQHLVSRYTDYVMLALAEYE